MKAIQEITILNYQSHASTRIAPAGAGELTVFTGPTDSGKSVVFRALRWLLYNGPLYMRTGCRAASISVLYDDGTRVTRERSASTNRYVVAVPGEEIQVYEGFRHEIPIEVQQAMGVRPVDVAGVTFEVNLARQHEPAFLGSGTSSPTRAKILGAIAGVEAVDLAVKSASADIFAGKQELTRLDREVDELEKAVRKYDYLPALADTIRRLETLQRSIEQAREQKMELIRIQAALVRLQREEAQARATLRRTSGAAAALHVLMTVDDHVNRRENLRRIRLSLDGLRSVELGSRETLRRTAGASDALAVLGQITATLERSRTLGRIHHSLRCLADSESVARAAAYKYAGGAEAISVLNKTGAKAERRSRLAAIRQMLSALKAQEDGARKRLATAQRQLRAEERMVQVADTVAKRGNLVRIHQRLRKIRQEEQRALGARELAATTLSRAQALYKQTLLEAGRCPLCGSPAHETHIKEVV